MELHWEGLLLGIATFLCIGIFHPIVIKAEYYFGKKSWWVFFVGGLLALIASILTAHIIYSSMLGVLSFSMFWSIGEIIEQEKRVLKGWFPKNPKRKYPEYKKKDLNNSL